MSALRRRCVAGLGAVAATALAIAALAAPAPSPARPAAPPPATSPPADPRPPLRVMIDPGHGGSNLGAPSVHRGVSEKHVTLALAFALRRALRARGAVVLMTRERDEYLSLRERVRRANHAAVDLLVSLHGNATDNHAQRGFETWILSPRARDVDARALRQGPGDGTPRPGPAAVAPLLDDLERGAALPGAAALARRIQRELGLARGLAADRGVRQGSQDVLLGATMPAVLVEVGFVDHPIEGVELLAPAVRSAIADALARAITGAAPAT